MDIYWPDMLSGKVTFLFRGPPAKPLLNGRLCTVSVISCYKSPDEILFKEMSFHYQHLKLYVEVISQFLRTKVQVRVKIVVLINLITGGIKTVGYERNSLPSKNFPCISMDMLQIGAWYY